MVADTEVVGEKTPLVFRAMERVVAGRDGVCDEGNPSARVLSDGEGSGKQRGCV